MREPTERERLHDPRPGAEGPLWLGGGPLRRRRDAAQAAHARALQAGDRAAAADARALVGELTGEG